MEWTVSLVFFLEETEETWLDLTHLHLDGGNSNICLDFHPVPREMVQFDYSHSHIFWNGLKSTTKPALFWM